MVYTNSIRHLGTLYWFNHPRGLENGVPGSIRVSNGIIYTFLHRCVLHWTAVTSFYYAKTGKQKVYSNPAKRKHSSFFLLRISSKIVLKIMYFNRDGSLNNSIN